MNTDVIALVEHVAPGTAKRLRSRRDAAQRLDRQNDRLDSALAELELAALTT